MLKKSEESIGSATALRKALSSIRDEKLAEHLQRFFKTKPGQYGYGDIFWGIRVPNIRTFVKRSSFEATEAVALVQDDIHEVRLAGLLVWKKLFEKAYRRSSFNVAKQKEIIDLYLENIGFINNWDLVDLSASLLGIWLLDRDRGLLDKLSASPIMWERRIAIVATHTFIKQGQYEDTLRLCCQHMSDKEDLMHKACGWMLREVGKRDLAVLEQFLEKYKFYLPRTTLRYAIERMSAEKRAYYMQK